MPDYTVNIDIPDHKRGDRWEGIGVIGPVLINGVQPPNTLTRIRMHLVHSTGVTFRIDSGNATGRNAAAVISNSTTWSANVPPIQNFLPKAGEWEWDMEFYETGNDKPLTLYKGVLTVLADTSR
jgi:hypothetical protein